MTVASTRPADFLSMVDASKGTVDRRMFSDQEIYETELERIFARAWNFMAHDSQIPNPGDFFLNFIGEDRVIVVRDKDMQPQVLINSCRHRGNAVCRAEEGHATSFMCTYHGWTYDLKGNLVGVPGFKEVYHEDLKREEWGLIKAAQVDSYKGFIFASMDPDAPDLKAYLGEVGRMGIDLIASRGEKMEIFPGIQKYIIDCNWKLSVDNVWDWYHANISHAAAFMSGYGQPRRAGAAGGQLATSANRTGPAAPVGRAGAGAGIMNQLAWKQLVVLGEYGHAISGPLFAPGNGPAVIDETWREKPAVMEALGPVGLKSRGHPNIFPTMWVTGNQVSLRHPRGPYKTEIWWFSLLDKSLPEETWSMIATRVNHTFGPAGMLEQEDGENWGQSSKGTRGVASRRFPLHFGMNLGRGEVIEPEAGPPHIETNVNEHAQLWLYRAWSEWMAAESWAELKAKHSPVPRDRV